MSTETPMTFGVTTESENKVEGAISDLTEAALNELNNIAPEAVQGYIKTAKDSIRPAEKFIEKLMPTLLKGYDKISGAWGGAQKYNPLQYSSLVVGLLMVFFGGTFGATIAAAETFKHLAYDDTKEAVAILYKQYEIADKAAEKDEDANPLASGEEKRKAELRRRALIIFKSIDPDAIQKALGAMWSGVFGVVCALRVKFAHAVTLGISIGDMTTGLFHRYGEKHIVNMLPDSLHKWVPMVSRYLCRTLAISLAWTLQVIIIAFHAALRGSNMFLNGIVHICVERGYIKKAMVPPKASARWNAIVYILAAIGFMYQAKTGFSVPFPLNLVLWPINILEFTLKMLIGTYGM